MESNTATVTDHISPYKFQWVKLCGEWIVAKWTVQKIGLPDGTRIDTWQICGQEDTFYKADFDDLGELISIEKEV